MTSKQITNPIHDIGAVTLEIERTMPLITVRGTTTPIAKVWFHLLSLYQYNVNPEGKVVGGLYFPATLIGLRSDWTQYNQPLALVPDGKSLTEISERYLRMQKNILEPKVIGIVPKCWRKDKRIQDIVYNMFMASGFYFGKA